MKLGLALMDKCRDEVIVLRTQYVTKFTSNPKGVKGIDPTIITHKLNVDPKVKPVKQKKRKFALERQKLISEEVKKLKDTTKKIKI